MDPMARYRIEFRYLRKNRWQTTPVRGFSSIREATEAGAKLSRQVGLVDIYRVRREGSFMLATVNGSGRVSRV